MEKRKQIDVTPTMREEIMSAFKCSRMAMWRALNFESDSELSRRIRRFALLKGGLEYTILPSCETIHDSEGMMRQWFINGAMLEANKKTGDVQVMDKDGELKYASMDVSVKELEMFQAKAMAL